MPLAFKGGISAPKILLRLQFVAGYHLKNKFQLLKYSLKPYPECKGKISRVIKMD